MMRRKGNHSKTKIHKVSASFHSSLALHLFPPLYEQSFYSTCLLWLTSSISYLPKTTRLYSHPRHPLSLSIFSISVSPDRSSLKNHAQSISLVSTSYVSIFYTSFIYNQIPIVIFLWPRSSVARQLRSFRIVDNQGCSDNSSLFLALAALLHLRDLQSTV